MKWLSIIPALSSIIITFKTKKLIPSLIIGCIIGAMLAAKSVMGGFISVGGYIIGVLSDKGSAYALCFLIIYGILSELITMAGGITAFGQILEKHVKSEKGVLGWSWALSLPTFFNSSFHFLSVGTMMNQVLDKVKASKEKFAFILSISSLQLILLIPIASANIGYMVSLIAENITNAGIDEGAYSIIAKSILWNFFSWVMLLLALGVTLFSLGFGKIKLGKAKTNELTEAHLEKKKLSEEKIEEYPKRLMNLVLPVVILLLLTVFFYWWTGRSKAPGFWGAISQADFSVALFTGAIITIIITCILYLFQKISLAEIQAHIVKGSEKVIGLLIILILSWALAKITQDLGFNDLIKSILPYNLPKIWMPVIIFIISGFISYTIGSSWATWALMIPLAVSYSLDWGIDISIMAGAVWAGGAVTEVVSPVAAEMAGIPYSKHFVTSLPYVAIGVGLTIIFYSIAGYLVLK